jgi:hypothetical protein
MCTGIRYAPRVGAWLILAAGACAQEPAKRGSPPASESSCVSTEYGDFSIKVRSIAAIHGGPILVKISYRYSGSADKLKIEFPPLWSGAKFNVPAGWSDRGRGPALVSGTIGRDYYYPHANRELTDYFALHRRYGAIKEGMYELTFRWNVHLVDETKTEIAVPRQTIKLDVRKATKERIEEVRAAIREDLNETDARADRLRAGWTLAQVVQEEQKERAERAESIARALDGANDPLVLRLRFELIDDLPESAAGRLASGMWLHGDPKDVPAEDQRNVIDAACAYLTRPYPKYGAWIVYYMAGKIASPGFTEAIKPRMDRLHPLVRACCFASFRDLFSDKERDKLLGDLAKIHQLPEPGGADTQIKRLDADSFRERESAMAALLKMGIPALESLKAALVKQHSAESSVRIKQLIEEIKKADKPENLPLEVETLKQLKEAKNARADAAIDAIASNKGDAWIVREARSIRDGRR